MPPSNDWLLLREAILLMITPHEFSQLLGHFLNIICEIFMPSGLPRFLRRRLQSAPLQPFGEALLCSICCKIFERRTANSSELSSWTCYRHQDDLYLLERSASDGCEICIKLYEWVSSIKNGPDWSHLQRRVPFGFNIRYHVLKTDVHNHFELQFLIRRLEGWRMITDHVFYTLTLKIVPAGEIRTLINTQTINDATISHSSILLAKLWINNCDEHHGRCQNLNKKWQPTRLIYVGTTSGPIARLVHTSNLTDVVKYASVSHCWGTEPIFSLLEDNIEVLGKELPIDQLPHRFRDAINLARVLGIDYLWIDSLCIIQHCLSDWAKESMLMCHVYANAYCNIAATGFADSQRCTSVTRDPRILKPREIQIIKQASPERGLPLGSCYCLDNFWEDGVVNAPLNRRSWVFQERYLSPRVLHFGTRQLFWECMEQEACEMFPSALPPMFMTNYKKNSPFRQAAPHLSTLPSDKRSMLKVWCEAVSGYTNGALTVETDKLVALSAIAQTMYGVLKCEYLAGLWQKGLPGHLLWYTSPLPLGEPQSGRPKRHKSYIAPSWSWASVAGKLTFMDEENRFTPYIAILGYDVTSKSGQTFGQVSAGYIRLRGPLTRARFLESEAKLNNWLHNTHEHFIDFLAQTMAPELVVKLVLYVDVFPEADPGPFGTNFQLDRDREVIGNRSFFLLSIGYINDQGTVAGLILQKTGVKGQYARIGMFMNDLHADVTNVAPLVARHRPALRPDDYEAYDEDEGYSTITIF